MPLMTRIPTLGDVLRPTTLKKLVHEFTLYLIQYIACDGGQSRRQP